MIREAERIETAGLPTELRTIGPLRQLADISGCRGQDIIAAWEPDAVDLAPLLPLDGEELVASCQSIEQLLRLLHFRGVTWTHIGEVAGTSRQSPINWAEGSIPRKHRVVALGQFFEPPVPAQVMEQLWRRSKDPDDSDGRSLRVEPADSPGPVPGTPDWIFAEERLRAGEGED